MLKKKKIKNDTQIPFSEYIKIVFPFMCSLSLVLFRSISLTIEAHSSPYFTHYRKTKNSYRVRIFLVANVFASVRSRLFTFFRLPPPLSCSCSPLLLSRSLCPFRSPSFVCSIFFLLTCIYFVHIFIFFIAFAFSRFSRWSEL